MSQHFNTSYSYDPKLNRFLSFALLLILLYLFFLSISCMGTAFKAFGAGFSKGLLTITSHPFVGLFVGILATSIIQSSSTTTSLVVALVASGAVNVANAVPVIMGANIGTSVTNTLVSIGHITRTNEFRRAFAAATVHDFFNILSVAIFLPLEITTGYLRHTASALAGLVVNAHGITFTSPLKAITKPLIKTAHAVLESTIGSPWASVLLLLAGLLLLFLSLYGIVQLMRTLVMGRMEIIFNRLLGRSAISGMTLGAVGTAIVQSSSVTTSLLVPLAGAGIIKLRQVFPVTLGANVGTTVTALMAAMATSAVDDQAMSGLVIALCHLLFNISGILIIYPIPFIRQIPLSFARGLGNLVIKSRLYAVAYVLIVFFLLPLLLIAFTNAGNLHQLVDM